MRRAALGLSFCLLTAVAHAADVQADEARAWLERMSKALATQNYDGLFTHGTFGQIDSMRIVHRVEKGHSYERMKSLDGSGREVVRTLEEVHAYLPDRKVVLVEPRGDDGALLKALPTPGPALDHYYQLTARGGGKLLGRDTVVIEVKPRDTYRYGYVLWLDEESAMPLRTVTADANGKPVEQMLFTRLDVKESIPAEDVEPTVDASNFKWVRTARRQAAMPQLPANGFRPIRLPPGFRLVASRLQVLPGSPIPAQHLIFSDGLAAISVFIEPGGSSGSRPPESSRMGSSNAFTTSIDGHVVTAVGEVPAMTVREIASSVVPLEPSPAAPVNSLVPQAR